MGVKSFFLPLLRTFISLCSISENFMQRTMKVKKLFLSFWSVDNLYSLLICSRCFKSLPACLAWRIAVPYSVVSLLSWSLNASPSFTWLKSLPENQTWAHHSCLKYPLAYVASKMASKSLDSKTGVHHISPAYLFLDIFSHLPCVPARVNFCVF